ncbi:2-amino-4-hydroxy-6-hydroxymethyldihydropteridinediphosphokinase [Jannaschia seohaensis]|uniref:2-amino-4-hydroxy-6-hydroxymethyldihydropteridine pyrophosphokinase n=2 Tax=Jannaschia seohaensis TaxID=475081 RepID=A0A2Y9AA30_9RHOB|nr:2-amino-4-hydroxy-6-hydroxymethyldihydropteridine diphosphokinase [Jannaschia seohaensis]SSA41401.1 2-amino-4-hydroxy-6-hydroxymethyldihydropteridinediphosphokinase [Jannaschia seohaensis]
MSPAAMLRRLHDLEARLGRVRGRRWGERNLDLDLLACGQLVRPDDVTQTFWRHLPPARQQREAPDRLILPHPRLQDRAFVLVPLAHVAPRWRHPLTGRTVAAMAAALPASARAEVRRLGSARNPLVKR